MHSQRIILTFVTFHLKFTKINSLYFIPLPYLQITRNCEAYQFLISSLLGYLYTKTELYFRKYLNKDANSEFFLFILVNLNALLFN